MLAVVTVAGVARGMSGFGTGMIVAPIAAALYSPRWALVILVVMLLFGRGKISELMGDVAKGIKSFKKGMGEDESAPAETKTVESKAEEAKDRG